MKNYKIMHDLQIDKIIHVNDYKSQFKIQSMQIPLTFFQYIII